MTTLEALLGQLENLNDQETVYARRPWTNDSDAVVAEEGTPGAREAIAAGLDYLLEVPIAKDVLATWSAWRSGRVPNSAEAFEAILYYATHDAFLPQ